MLHEDSHGFCKLPVFRQFITDRIAFAMRAIEALSTPANEYEKFGRSQFITLREELVHLREHLEDLEGACLSPEHEAVLICSLATMQKIGQLNREIDALGSTLQAASKAGVNPVDMGNDIEAVFRGRKRPDFNPSEN